MELKGLLKSVSIGLTKDMKKTLDLTFSFPFSQYLVDDSYRLMNKEKALTVIFKPFRKKRSLDANAYLWVLLQKLADALSTPGNRVNKWDVYLDMLEDYGSFTHIVVKPEAVERMKKEWRTVREIGEINVGNQVGVQLQCYYGSSTYDTAEMSRLIDGVVTRCRELDIETLPPYEIERMKNEWGVDVG